MCDFTAREGLNEGIFRQINTRIYFNELISQWGKDGSPTDKYQKQTGSECDKPAAHAAASRVTLLDLHSTRSQLKYAIQVREATWLMKHMGHVIIRNRCAQNVILLMFNIQLLKNIYIKASTADIQRVQPSRSVFFKHQVRHSPSYPLTPGTAVTEKTKIESCLVCVQRNKLTTSQQK